MSQLIQEATTRIAPDALYGYATRAFQRLGATLQDAQTTATHLVDATLCGHDSHGIVRILEYAETIESSGRPPTDSDIAALIIDNGATVVLDGDGCLGPAIMGRATALAVDRAEQYGPAAVAVRHAPHIGRLGFYAERICAANQVCLLTSGALGREVGVTVLPGTALRIGGGNPWCYGFPRERSDPVIIDMSSSATAEGKIRIARLAGASLPPGLAVDKHGKQTRDPEAFYDGGGVLPLGGVAAHKGLALLIASALLGSLSSIAEEPVSLAGASRPPNIDAPALGGVLLIAVNVARFGPPELYQHLVDRCLSDVAVAAEDAGHRLVVPGMPEAAERHVRREEGIPVPAEIIARLDNWAADRALPTLSEVAK